MRERVLRELTALRARHDMEIRRLVVRASGLGVRSADIAEALGVSRATLWRRYSEQLSRRGRDGGSAAQRRA